MDQSHYIDQILRKFNMQDCKPVSIPLDKSQVLSQEMSPKTSKERKTMKNILYREAIGCIMYAQLGTRSDLAYAVSVVSRFNNDNYYSLASGEKDSTLSQRDKGYETLLLKRRGPFNDRIL